MRLLRLCLISTANSQRERGSIRSLVTCLGFSRAYRERVRSGDISRRRRPGLEQAHRFLPTPSQDYRRDPLTPFTLPHDLSRLGSDGGQFLIELLGPTSEGIETIQPLAGPCKPLVCGEPTKAAFGLRHRLDFGEQPSHAFR